MKKNIQLTIGALAATALLATGCSTMEGRTQHQASSLYTYLYSDKTEHVDQPTIPALSLPLRVGIAFVPPEGTGNQNYYSYGGNPVFSEDQKQELIKTISAQFKQYPFVKSIEYIPTTYLTPKGGFANLNQLKAMYGVDVMALVSYDQVQFTGENMASIAYWTVVGLYVVPGEKNETKTMLDTAVYDIASRKLLFRAPGFGSVKGLATPLNQSEELRANSQKAFAQAATNLVANLQVELAKFKERAANAPEEYKVEYKPGYTGSGALGGLEIALAGGLGLGWLLRRKQ